ncbi:hypothetical protein [Clostridium autoethanogenum]|nr:hypothetical protein [Clostridium autoethanogenum]
MKNLNIREGNISGFFKGSTDNIGIFHNKIIPTINDKIEDIDHNSDDNTSNITVSFLETLKVANELPILMSIIRSIEELYEFTSPLIDIYEEAYRLQKSEQLFKKKGQEIYSLLNKIHQENLNHKSIKTKEYNKLSKNIEQLEWRKDNLRYIEELKKVHSLDKRYHELSIELDSQNKLIETTKSDLKSSKINVLLKKVHLCLVKIQDAKLNLDILEKNYNINQIKHQLDEIKIYFQDNYKSIKENWKKKVTLNYRSEISHSNKVNAIKDSINNESILNRKIKNSTIILNEKIKNHLDKQEIVINQFGEKTRSFLDDVICAYESNCKAISNTITDNTEKIKLAYSDIENIQNELGMLKNKIDSSQELILTLSVKLQKCSNEEKRVKEKATSLLKENLEELYIRSDYEALKNKIALRQEELEAKLKKYRHTLLELEIEMSLIEEGKPSNIYIPNKDLVRLKKLLDENQISNMYGTYFLKQYSREERIFYLKRNPSLPFSIVVLKEEFENIDLSFLREELFSSMIILVDGLNASKLNGYDTINPSLQKVSEINYLPMDKTFDLVTDEYEFNKKITNTEKKFDDILFEIDEKEKLMTELNNLFNWIDIILANKLSRELENKIIDLKQLNHDIKIREQTLASNLTDVKHNIVTSKSNISKLNTELREKEKQTKYLEQWKDECKTYCIYKQELNDFNLKLEKSNSKLAKLNSELKELNDQFQRNKLAYSEWLKLSRQDFTDLFNLLENISFPDPISTNDFYENDYLKPLSFGHSLNRAHYKRLTIYKDLLSERSNRNAQIGRCISNLEALNKELADHQEKLNILDYFNWCDSAEPMDDLSVLDKISADLDAKVRELENSIIFLNANIDQNDKQRSELSLSVIKIEKQLQKDYPEYGAVKFKIDNVDKEREKIKILKEETINHQKSLKKDIDYLNNEIKKIDNLFGIFSTLHINESNKETILTEDEKISLHHQPTKFYDDWYMQYDNAKKKHDSKKNELAVQINRIENYINLNNNLPLNFKNDLINFLIKIRNFDYEQAIQSIQNYNNWAQYNIEEKNEQKKKADDAVNFWVERTSRRVLEICNCINDLGKKMKIRNWNDIIFPLVKIEKSKPLPQNVDDFRFQVKQFCIDMIEKIMEKNLDVNNLTAKQLSKHINISNIVLYVLGEFPKLKIYIPTIEGPLLRGEPNDSYYKEWEVINNGSSTSSTKSGGQTLMAQFIVLSMLMRQRADDCSWLFLVSDNPFGTMSAPELVEAVFSLLELLKIQWLVVGPPITDVNITSMFNTVYQMDVLPDNNGPKLIKLLEKKNRKFLQYINILKPKQDKI